MKMIIDGENATLGRLSSFIAKQALIGKEVVVVNAKKIIVTGNKKKIVDDYMVLRRKGGSSQKGPTILSSPERILKRTVRGMLPHRKGRGMDAMKRIRCYNGLPEEYKEQKKVKSGRKNKGVKLEEISKLMRGGKSND
ncbi:MAG: 50S ribosomal protein L13 [archaeon]